MASSTLFRSAYGECRRVELQDSSRSSTTSKTSCCHRNPIQRNTRNAQKTRDTKTSDLANAISSGLKARRRCCWKNSKRPSKYPRHKRARKLLSLAARRGCCPNHPHRCLPCAKENNRKVPSTAPFSHQELAVLEFCQNMQKP